jgi:hypothetical protein
MEKALKDKTITHVIYEHQAYPVVSGKVTLPDGAVVDDNLFGTTNAPPPASGSDSKAGTAKVGQAQVK